MLYAGRKDLDFQDGKTWISRMERLGFPGWKDIEMMQISDQFGYIYIYYVYDTSILLIDICE